MKAMVLRKQASIFNHPLKLEDVPVPEPGKNEILIRVEACGVCHTDLHTVEGDFPLIKTPVIPGHQVVGRVEKIGSNVKTFKHGDRGAAIWLHSACGVCEFCGKGLENLCDNAKFTGLSSDGGYAEYIKVPADFAYHLQGEGSAAEIAPLLCGGIVGYRALKISSISRGENLGIYGFGSSAYLVMQVALHRGCKVYVFTRRLEHQKHALELGAVWAGKTGDTPPESLDSSIIFAPAGSIVPEALRDLKKGGTLSIAGIYMTEIPSMDYKLLYGEKTIKSVANSTRQDAEEFLEQAKKIPVKTDTEVFTLENANEALCRIKKSTHRGSCVLIV